MSREDLEIKIPESDLKFLKEHGFHLVDEDTAEIVSKMVYFDLKEHHDEKISIMIVFSASFPGSYAQQAHPDGGAQMDESQLGHDGLRRHRTEGGYQMGSTGHHPLVREGGDDLHARCG